MDLRGKIFQIGLTDLEIALSSTEVYRVDLEGSGYLLEEAHLALEDWRGTAHAFSCEERREDPVPACVGEGATFPHGEFSRSHLAHGDMRVHRQVHSMRHLSRVEIHEASRG